MEIWEGFLYGVFGGVLSEVLGLFKLRHQEPENLPTYLKSGFYWLVTTLMSLMGGVLVVIYLRSNFSLEPIVAVNIGASAPLILGTLTSQAPDPPSRID